MFETLWKVLGVTAALILMVILVAVVIAPKNVDYYYVSAAQSQGVTTCVYAHWTWHADEKAFCSDSKETALDFMARANAALKGVR